MESTNDNVSKSSALAPTRHKQPPTKYNRRKKVLMILNHNGPASKAREIRQKTGTHKHVRNRNVSLKSVAKLLGIANQISSLAS